MSKKINLSELDLKERLVEMRRVTKVVKGGRRLGFYALVVVGNGDGIVGYGIGRAKDPFKAKKKAIYEARKNLVRIIVHNKTLPHNIETKYNASKVILRPAANGTGVIAGGGVRVVLECAGVANVLGKIMGSNNRTNAVRATIKALQALRTPQMIAADRGISVEQVFNG